jgi:hypothetical protein
MYSKLYNTRVVDEISRNIYFVFREIIFFISQNFVSRNITKGAGIFLHELQLYDSFRQKCSKLDTFTA